VRPFLSAGWRTVLPLLALLSVGCGGRSSTAVDTRLAGDWDYYVTLGATPSGGFETRRRMGVVHFDGPSADGAWLKRRSGAALNPITKVTLTGTDLMLSLGDGQEIRATVNGDTIAGQIHRGGKPINRVWLVKRPGSLVWESSYELWPGDVSQPTFGVTVDPAVPMTARDGTTLMNYVARPVGDGPFGVVLERTPYLRTDKANGEFWASRGYIYVKQDVRGRGGSGGVLDMNAMQEQDGYVEWAAALPGSNGRVGVIGGSNPGLYAWYAAIAHPPHLATIAPTVATADPLRIVPYIDMVFSPTILPWLCLTAVKDSMSDISNVGEVEAGQYARDNAEHHLRAAHEIAAVLGCP
jgi:X-Pro dipeptidyl-peptidase (S15 family)